MSVKDIPHTSLTSDGLLHLYDVGNSVNRVPHRLCAQGLNSSKDSSTEGFKLPISQHCPHDFNIFPIKKNIQALIWELPASHLLLSKESKGQVKKRGECLT